MPARPNPQSDVMNAKPRLHRAGTAKTTRSDAIVLTAVTIGPDHCEELTVGGIEELQALTETDRLKWINVSGPIDIETLEQLGQIFELHPLALEDVAKGRQRAKFEEFEHNHFLVAHMVALTDQLHTDQLSIFFNSDCVISFHEEYAECIDTVRERLRRRGGMSQNEAADYLAYILMDAVIDGYFPVLEQLGDRLEELEDEILLRHSSKTPKRIHEIKRDIVTLRRCIWPLREAVNALFRETTPMVSPETRVYLRDCYDHAIRLLDLVEMYRELCSDLMDLHLSSVSNRMNEVMKVLAIFTTLFIPPTLIAGIYGMNFHDEKSPFNMPELGWYFGYPFALGLMLSVMVGLLFWIKKKGWLDDITKKSS